MNSIDIKNINKELEKRKASNYYWAEGGEMSKDDIMLRTTKELEQLLTDFENKTNDDAALKVKKLVDKMFEKYADENDNMIAISAANYIERSTYEQDPMDIDWNGFSHKYNQLYFPIGAEWDCGNYWSKEGKDKETLDFWKKKWDEYNKDLQELTTELYKIKNIFSAEDYFKDNNDAINECWYGVIGIMKDYRVVSFVIRDDGMLCDEEGYDTFYNTVIRIII